MKKIISLLTLATVSFTAFSQQDAQFTHFFFNNLTTNPASAGINDQICLGLTMRDQWVRFDGHPRTAALNFSMPFARQHGVGLVVIGDKLGASNDVNAKLSYSFHIPIGALSNGRKLGVGLDAGLINKGIDFTKPATNPNDVTDPFLAGNSSSVTKPDIGAGVFYKTPTLYFGLSSQKLIESEVNYGNAITHLRRHYYLTGGYKYVVDQTWNVKPSFLIKNDGTATQFDLNTLVEYKETIWLGLSYRFTDAVAAMIGYQWNNVRVGYSYDYTTNGLSEPKEKGSQGSHEIFVGYCMKPPVPPKPPKYIDVTWL